MSNQNINPEKITKPIQLLGAWLAGLFSIDSCFLFAAANMTEGSWESIVLVIAAIINVPIFLIAVFLLQTKFRPELQEDSYYSTYLSQKTNKPIKIKKDDAHYIELRKKIESIESLITDSSVLPKTKENLLCNLTFGINLHLSDQETIKTKLADRGISSTIFGAKEPPEHRTVSLARFLSRKTRNEVLKLISELGFESYSFYDDGEEIDEDVLLGSYGDPKYQVFKKTA